VSAGWSLEPGFIVLAVAVLAVAALASVISVGLLTNARQAKGHLDRAAAFALPPNAAPSLPPEAPAALRPRAAGSPFTDPAAQQIFGQLTQYYAANINQSFAIFWASLLAMVAGFIIIIVGIATAGANTANAIVAGTAGVLSQFIAATFLVALRSTQEQSTAYAQSLADLRSRDLRAAADAQATMLGLELLGPAIVPIRAATPPARAGRLSRYRSFGMPGARDPQT